MSEETDLKEQLKQTGKILKIWLWPIKQKTACIPYKIKQAKIKQAKQRRNRSPHEILLY
ncbi:hypothetical protein [Methanolobus vulcani]|uniref:hypothetical protein n=1 Tax=Methanolobus vulcani TaxID=38026 RepID=UPI0012B69766|nr:hypothetical protein [Methanolobus vulcani]